MPEHLTVDCETQQVTVVAQTAAEAAAQAAALPAAQAQAAALATAQATAVTLLGKAGAALAANAAYLAIGSPNNAQNGAQLVALTRQVNALLRLVSSTLDSTAGT